MDAQESVSSEGIRMTLLQRLKILFVEMLILLLVLCPHGISNLITTVSAIPQSLIYTILSYYVDLMSSES